ncbi:MAG: sigma 54-interacting transcriptional regulator [Deltaproteobacteria bacterium]|nr:sigma 54-interacting transcriptional regulator [Deltaproteobacteria bacterium]MBW1870471.1 sigma 54-interacting transcriptional regulator [Deltaproteobacteria bacterium]
MLKLIHLTSGKEFDFPNESDVMTIGRADTNQVAIDDPHVSALHGQIICRETGYCFQDLNSTNGSAVVHQGKKTLIDNTMAAGFRLGPGDQILLGSDTEPVVLEVIGITESVQPDKPIATMVATQQMASAEIVGGRIESVGGTLVPFLAFTEDLARALTTEDAFLVYSACLKVVGPHATTINLVDLAQGIPRVIFSMPEKSRLPACNGFNDQPLENELTIVENGPKQGQTARLPMRLDNDHLLYVLLATSRKDFISTELDSISLATNLLAARLRQLHLVSELQSARARLAVKNRYLQKRAQGRASHTMIGDSPAMLALREQIQKVALSDATVLISGPSGSGKELVAREIHRLSTRHSDIFAALNCGALVDSLLEPELFGCKKGAYTGANRDREGLFEVAHEGTLFLDEIGDMSPALQVKLLRVLESHEITPVGSTRSRRVNVRVLAATHRDLNKEVANGSFREDLFYRINVFPIQVPTLTERREDIGLLARYFLDKFAQESGSNVHDISDSAMRVLASQAYPGNIRQLANIIQRAILLASDQPRIVPEHLAIAEDNLVGQAVGSVKPGKLKEQMGEIEKALIIQTLKNTNANRTHAARQLGITRQALLGKLNRYGIK